MLSLPGRTIRPSAPITLLVALGAMLFGMGNAVAQPNVYFDGEPYCTENTGDTFTASVWVDAGPESLACYQLFITYDRSRLALLSVAEGSLFRSSGFPTFFSWTQRDADTTAVADCLIGAGTYVLGPGELASLEFQVTDCSEPIQLAIDITENRALPPPLRQSYVLDVNRMLIPGTTFTDGRARICTDCSQTSVGEAMAPSATRLLLRPNPASDFLRLDWEHPDGAASILVFDAAGRLRFEHPLAGVTSGSLRWNLTAEDGTRLPLGIYWVELRAGSHPLIQKFVRMH